MAGTQILLTWLRATAEATRLRLVALCAQQELSVSDLARVLCQSEPRVSRHLRILTEAGLLERVRQGQWVHYRLPQGTPAGTFLHGLLGQLDRADPVLLQDRERIEAPGGGAASPSAAASRLGRELRGVVESEPLPASAAALLVGVGHPELLAALAAPGGECVAIAHSRRAAQAARATAERQALACRVSLAAGPEELTQRDLDRLGRTFDVVVLDHLDAPHSALPGLLAAARRALSDGGRLWLFEPYETLDGPGQRVVEHPIARLRRWLAETGFHCERIRPLEAGRHVLAVCAAPATAASLNRAAPRAS